MRSHADTGTTFRVALTFDAEHPDRPHRAGVTAAIIELLAERHVPTTWFLQGRWVEAFPDLARQVVADGEGITVLAEINVTGAVDNAQAKAIARRIATSPLVKTALFGHDANWGRVLMAAGSAPWNGGYAAVEPEKITLRYNGSVVLDRGTPTDVEPDVAGPSCTIDLDLGLGPGSAGYLTSDLSYDYVRINADYRT